MEDLADQFARLETITRSASIFLLGSGDKYTGPIRPVGIVRQTSNDSTPLPKGENGSLSQNYLVLADHVPLEFTLGEVDGSEPYPTGVVLARLSDKYEFLDWIPQTKTLGYLQAIFWCSDGSMESACAENSGGRFTYQVVFRREREQPRTEQPRARAQVEAFNTDEYSRGGWKTAVEQQYTHYQRLGLNPHQHVSAESVKNANLVRANWWRQRKSQADSGKNNPLIAELVPHFKIAETNLQMAVAVLSDVDQKAAYDRQIETAGAKVSEEKLREFIRFTLRDKILTPIERNDLLDQARDLGVTRERAEELIRDEMVRTGSTEADDTAATMTPPRDPTTPAVSGTDRPRLALSKTALSLGTLRRGQDCSRTFVVDNLGGGVLQGTIDVSHPEWMKVSQPAIDPRRHHQEVTIRVDTSNLALGKHYVGMVEVRSNGGQQGVRIDFSIELEKDAISRYRTKLFWGGLLAGGVFGLLLHALTPNVQTGMAITQVAGLVGFIAFVVVGAMAGGWGGGIGAFVLTVFCDTALGFASTRVSSAVVWAMIVSAFLYFCARRLLVANLAGDRRARGLVAATGVGLVAIIILSAVGITAGVPITPSHPNLSIALPVEDKLVGSSIGFPSGIRWASGSKGKHALDRGAIFSAADSSRIEYPGLIPLEGTVEFWIKVNSGYHFNNFQLNANQDVAMIFSSDPQGGDVTWPGTTTFTVSRYGTLSYWMATSMGDTHTPPTEARSTKFRFAEWHALGVSYGGQGEYIMLDGKVVASSPLRTQTFGRAGNHQEPLDIPTIGETESHFWAYHRYEGGFDGILGAFRVSAKQKDWLLAEGIKDKGGPNSGESSSDSQKAEHGDPIHACALIDNQDYSGQMTVAAEPWIHLNRGEDRDGYSLSTDGSLSYLGQMLTNNIPVTGGSDNHWNYAQSIALSSKSPSGRFAILQGCEQPDLEGLCWALFVVDHGSHHIEKTFAGKYGPDRSLAFIRGSDEYAILHHTDEGVTTYYRIHLPTGQSVECDGKTKQPSLVGSTENPATPIPTPTRQHEGGKSSVLSRLDSSERLLRKDELEGLTKWDLEILRNLPYARHGYSFRKQTLKNYFSQQPWYRATVPATQFQPSVFTPVEQQNIALISKFQKDRGLE